MTDAPVLKLDDKTLQVIRSVAVKNFGTPDSVDWDEASERFATELAANGIYITSDPSVLDMS